MSLTLAACNNEDFQTEENSVAKSPVVFNVSMDGNYADSRAAWGGGSGYTLQWLAEDADQLSFFHGISKNQEGSVGSAQNAIYRAETVGDDGVRFLTQSMINEGLGIMVYPCDTTFSYKGEKLYYTLPVNQTPESNLLLPFMSNAITIAPYNGIKGDGAGYGKDYNIALKQIATQFTLDADWKGETLEAITALSDAGKILPINVVSSELSSQLNFTGDVEIKISSAEPSYNNKVTGRDKWTNVTVAEPSGRFNYGTIKTTAVKGLEKSEFTLLPTKRENVAETAIESVKINTRYGSVTIDNESGDVWQRKPEASDNDQSLWQTVSEGIYELAGYTCYVMDDEKSKFNKEAVGVHVTRHIAVDLANLDMSDVHIKDDKHLHDIILVHDALQEGKDVTFTIDGDENGVFEMSTTTVAMLNERPEISVKACRGIEGEACQTIVLTGATEVPTFKFLVGDAVKVELAAETTAWTWTTGAKNMYNVNTLINKGILNVNNNATIQVNSWINSHKTAIYNNGTINIVSGTTKQVNDMTNNGTINVAVDAEYYNEGTFVNDAKSLAKQGKVYNSGVFGNINDGVINNYGYIKQMTENSKTFITNNQTTNVAFGTPWATDNKYGTIELFNNTDDNYSVSNEANQGFIMITTNAATVTAEEIGVEANYVKIAGNCTSLDFTRTKEENGRVLFIEIASNKEVIWTTEGTNIAGLKVNENCKLYIKKGNSVSVKQASYVKGKIYKGGEFDTASFVSYFGDSEDEADASNVIKWAN